MDGDPARTPKEDLKRASPHKNFDKKTGSTRRPNQEDTTVLSGKPGKKHGSGKKSVKTTVARHKLIIRLLPPNLTQQEFLECISSVVEDGFLSRNVEDQYYMQGHYSKKPFKQPVYSRAYFTFYGNEQLEGFARKVANVKFVDDTDNAMVPTFTVSAFVKKMRTEETKAIQKANAKLEGTIRQDKVFQQFLNSVKFIETNANEFQYSDLSIISPIAKVVERRRKEQQRIREQGEKAITELAGDMQKDRKVKKKKNKATNEKKEKGKKKDSKDPEPTAPRRRSKKQKKGSGAEPQDKNNMVIIEAAGMRELQRRERLKKKAQKKIALQAGDPSQKAVESVTTPKKQRSKESKKAKAAKSKKRDEQSGKPQILQKDNDQGDSNVG
ncbi:LAMI_0H08174g1_1 [Lachancea mirantina]|uniref:LAMI_0H08174g1_1 n=1 Tax=Lachancea mirantina TaxID=1230905 RepID=A0A1G4KGE5_9SACH|nr:LAMI_0H08174g1_1 [Lachancea mirantina]